MGTEEGIRREVRAFLAEAWDPDLTVAVWWDRLMGSGWAVPTWPEDCCGRGLSRDLARVVTEELRAAGAIGPPAGMGMLLAGPTIIAHGTPEQRRRYLPPIVSGQVGWCQLFSEPGAGSDLASLQTRAVRDGDEWVVTGQKVWASAAYNADYGMLLARTDRDAPKHRGITWFAFPMDQAGVEVRPLREMTGRSLFTEVFLDEARVGDDAVVGRLHDGWAVANTTLAIERVGLGSGGSGGSGGAYPGPKAGMLDVRAGDVAAHAAGSAAQAGRVERALALLTGLARELGCADEPLVRQGLAEIHALDEVGRMTAIRARAERLAGRELAAAGNIAKLLMSRTARRTREVGLAMLGPHGMLMGSDTPGGGAVQAAALWAPSMSIYGGSDEIQRNIIGERVLGLPREPGPDRDVPFKDLLLDDRRPA